MKNVCFFNSADFWGGGEKLHLEYAEAFKNKGYNVYLVSKANSPLARKGKEHDLSIYNISIRNLSFLNPVKHIQLIRFFRKEKIDTVIFSASQDIKIGSLAAKLAGVKNIVYLRGLALSIKNNLINQFLFNKVLTHIVANSEETKKTILRYLGKYIDSSKVKVIYHGIQVTAINKDEKLDSINKLGKGIILGNVGRLDWQKGQNHLIEIAAKLKEDNVEFTLFIAGIGEMQMKLEKLINKYNLHKEVILLGFVKDVQKLLNSIDIFLLTSTSEGFGFATVEAMASYKPVIAFDITSSPEIVIKDKTGILVEYPNINMFAKQIELLIKDKALRKQLGENGRASVLERFQLKDRIDEFEQYLLG
jgi:glycosyltransferase involved in cell wall biosynthesis